MPRDPQIFGQVTDPLSAAAVAGRKVEQQRLASRLADDPQQDLDERGFAGAVGSQEPKDLAAADLESYFPQRLLSLAKDEPLDIGLAQFFDGDGGVRHSWLGSGSRKTNSRRSPCAVRNHCGGRQSADEVYLLRGIRSFTSCLGGRFRES